MLKVIRTGFSSAEKNMQIDHELLANLSKDPILHLYRWSGDSVTHGYFIRPEKIFNLSAIKKNKIDVARRPTGGGVVFHIWDLAFSFLMPSSHPRFSENTLDNYQYVNEVVLESVKEFIQNRTNLELIDQSYPIDASGLQNFCMARPTIYDVVLNGKKIAGAAQRRKKQGYLHQGTISLATPSQNLLAEVLQDPDPIVQAMLKYTHTPLGSDLSQSDLEDARSHVEKKLERQFEKSL